MEMRLVEGLELCQETVPFDGGPCYVELAQKHVRDEVSLKQEHEHCHNVVTRIIHCPTRHDCNGSRAKLYKVISICK